MKQGTRAERLNALVAGSYARQLEGQPVHTWELATLEEVSVKDRIQNTRVEQFMILSCEVGRWAGNIAEADLPDRVLVDWVRVWKKE